MTALAHDLALLWILMARWEQCVAVILGVVLIAIGLGACVALLETVLGGLASRVLTSAGIPHDPLFAPHAIALDDEAPPHRDACQVLREDLERRRRAQLVVVTQMGQRQDAAAPGRPR